MKKSEKNKEKIVVKEAESVSNPVPANASKKEKEKKKRKRCPALSKAFWMARSSRRAAKRKARSVGLFLLAVLLGVLVAFGSLVGGVFFAFGGVTIDFLQHFGIAENADQYLTRGGEVDLTDTSLLELVLDMKNVGANKKDYTLKTLIDRYGLALPESVSEKLPEGLMNVGLDQLFSSEAGKVVTENLTFGYIFSLLPDGTLSERITETLKDRPLSLLTSKDWKGMLGGIEVGYFLGVTYDAEGNVIYANPDVPTLQETIAKLDLGDMMSSFTGNGDFLGVLAENLGTQKIKPLLGGMTDGALIEKLAGDKTIADVIVKNETTGRYEISFNSMAAGMELGELLGYVKVGEEWYSAYTDNEDDTDDVLVTGINARLANMPLSDLMNGNLSLDKTFEGLYFGDLQSGYVRGTAILGTPVSPEEEAPITGYEWSKDGAPVNAMMKALANIAVNDVLNGNLDIAGALSGIALGDVEGYTKESDGKWYKQITDPTPGTEYVGAVQNALANIALSDVLNGSLNISDLFNGIYLGDVEGYTKESDDKWYKQVTDPAPGTEYVGAVQNALAEVLLSDVMDGNLDIADALSGLLLGDVTGYVKVEDPLNPGTHTWEKKDGTPVTGGTASLSDTSLSDLLNGNLNLSEKVKGLTLAEAMEYEKHDDVWYVTYDSENPAASEKLTGILAALADTELGDMSSAVGNTKLGEVLGYFYYEGAWYTDAAHTAPATGVLAQMADLTVDGLSNSAAVTAKINEVTLADALGYTEVGGVWYSYYTDNGDDTDDIKLTGVLAALASTKLKNMNTAIGSMELGKVLGYTYDSGVWYTDATLATPADGVMAELADLTVDDLSDSDTVSAKINGMELSAILGYEKVGGVWYSEYDSAHPENNRITGVMAELMESDVGSLSADINNVKLGAVFGYHQNGSGVWVDDTDTPAAGFTAALCDTEIGNAGSAVDDLKLGKAMGYYEQAGVWYTDDAYTTPVTGITAPFASLTAAEFCDSNNITAKVGEIKLGDALGYHKDAGVWKNSSNEPATGMIGALCDTRVDNVDSAINGIAVGTMLNYTEVGGVWYEVYDSENPAACVKASGVIAALCDSNLTNMGSKMNTLTLAEVFGYHQNGSSVWVDDTDTPATGIVMLLGPDTQVNNLSSVDLNVKTLGDFYDAGLIITDAHVPRLTLLCGTGWRDYTFTQLLNQLLGVS